MNTVSRTRQRLRRWSVLGLLAGASAGAQATKQAPAKLDRNVVPAAGKAPELRVPTWTRTTLANGAELVVSVKRGLPLVTVNFSFLGGASQYEDPAKTGVASLAAQMLREGTTTRSGDQFADAEQLLGTSLSASVGNESGSMGFTALTSRLDGALELSADMLLNPTFPADALERLRAQRLVALTTARDQVGAIANTVFAKVLYGDEHPFGRVVTEPSLKAITRDDVVAFHRAYFQPGRAVITVVGDVDPARVRASVEKAYANWAKAGERPTFAYPATPAQSPTTIWLVDKPKAAQTQFALGLPGPPRSTEDYYALAVMNRILGGHFQSRLNYLIREVKGYSYGVSSSFAYGRGPGAFRAGGAVSTPKTDSALIDFMAELRSVQGGRPFTSEELFQGKDGLVQSLPAQFDRVNGIAISIANIYVQGLPETYYQDLPKNIAAVTSDDLVRVAKKYIDLERLNIVLVGDRAVIEEPLRKLNIGPIVLLDLDGKRVASPAVP